MNKFELKLKLKKAYPIFSNNIVKKIIASTEFINKDVQAMIDRSVSSVKNLYTVQTIDDYAEQLMVYTQNFLDKLDKLGIHWLISLPTGVNFTCNPETEYIVVSEPFAVQSGFSTSHIKHLIKEGKGKTFMMSGISIDSKSNYIISGQLVKKSIFAKLSE